MGSIKDNIFTLLDISGDLKDKGIEGVLTENDLKIISTHFSIIKPPTKSQIQLFFSEMLSSRTVVAVSAKFRKIVGDFDKKFSSILD